VSSTSIGCDGLDDHDETNDEGGGRVTGPLTVTVFGLGEAGSRIAGDLATAGADVNAYDPAGVETPKGVHRHPRPEDAAEAATLVMGITAAADARTALSQALGQIPPGAVYADLATSAPGLKRELAESAGGRGLEFVDVALMATVPGRGLATPALASGPGAGHYAGALNPLGARCEVIGCEPGDAATRKLLRSVVMKGLAGVVIEAVRAAEASGQQEWLWEHLVEVFSAADGSLLSRLVSGTGPHAVRRHDEMEAAATLLEELGIDPVMTRATVEGLARIPDIGVPDIPEPGDD
jgi:3-hydroxyisobutyrate dehydrogenase-like beta-hydroxyacid dehydrogenase